jgi:hypothetical protein
MARSRVGSLPITCGATLRSGPALRIVNLETSITTSRCREPKAINHKMAPRNVDCLKAAAVSSPTTTFSTGA